MFKMTSKSRQRRYIEEGLTTCKNVLQRYQKFSLGILPNGETIRNEVVKPALLLYIEVFSF